MIRISKKCSYGIKAILMLASDRNQKLYQTREIAQKQQIPRQYLEQIFSQLARYDVVKSVRGKYGGYRLARQASQITLLEVIQTLDGPINLLPAEVHQNSPVFRAFKDVENTLKNSLLLSFADLLKTDFDSESDYIYYI